MQTIPFQTKITIIIIIFISCYERKGNKVCRENQFNPFLFKPFRNVSVWISFVFLGFLVFPSLFKWNDESESVMFLYEVVSRMHSSLDLSLVLTWYFFLLVFSSLNILVTRGDLSLVFVPLNFIHVFFGTCILFLEGFSLVSQNRCLFYLLSSSTLTHQEFTTFSAWNTFFLKFIFASCLTQSILFFITFVSCLALS